MGSYSSDLDIQKKYDFIQLADDLNFKKAKIYRNKQPNYDYLMLIDAYITAQNKMQIHQQLTKFRHMYFQQNNFQFLRVIDFGIKNQNVCKYAQINICLQYLRHSLSDYISWRKHHKSCLKYNQIVMAIVSSIQAYQKTCQYQFISPSLKLSECYVTQEGFIKFNPLLKKMCKHLVLPKQENCSNFMPCHKIDIEGNTKKQQKYIHSYLNVTKEIPQKEYSFLLQLKHFVNQIVWDTRSNNLDNYNPQEQYYAIYQKRQIKRLLKSVHLAKTIKQIRETVGQPVIQSFLSEQNQISRLSHETSEAKLEKLVSELSQKNSLRHR